MKPFWLGILRDASGMHYGVGILRRAPEGGRCLRQRQCLRCRTARRSVPTWEAFGAGTQILLQAGQTQESSGGRAMSPTAPMSAVPDRSEIGPYRGGSRGRNADLATGGPNSGELQGVGRFLRKRQRLRCRTARRSVPTWEAFGAGTRIFLQAGQTQASSGGRAISPKAPMSAVPDRSEIGPYLGGLRGRNAGLATNWPNSGELWGVGRFLRKRHVCGAGPLGNRKAMSLGG